VAGRKKKGLSAAVVMTSRRRGAGGEGRGGGLGPTFENSHGRSGSWWNARWNGLYDEKGRKKSDSEENITPQKTKKRREERGREWYSQRRPRKRAMGVPLTPA